VDLKLFGEVFITLFVIMDPPGTIPVVLGLASGKPAKIQRQMAWQAVTVALLVIVVFAVFGQQILDYLGISLPALQGAGGLLLLLVALQLLTGKTEDPVGGENVNVALVPLGTPLLAGPGAIVATMVFVRQIDNNADLFAVAAGIVAVHIAMWISLRFSVVFQRILRDSGITLVTRIAGLLLSAIAVQLIANAVRAFVEVGATGH
jgi:multiple antibiotic resistance protein